MKRLLVQTAVHEGAHNPQKTPGVAGSTSRCTLPLLYQQNDFNLARGAVGRGPNRWPDHPTRRPSKPNLRPFRG